MGRMACSTSDNEIKVPNESNENSSMGYAVNRR